MNLEPWYAQLLARWKFLLSFRKRNWGLDDYPVMVRRQPAASAAQDAALRAEWGDEVRWKTPAYIAHLVKWPAMDGLGDTPAEARRELREKFERICARRGSKPRPGTLVPLEIAPQRRIAERPALTDEFVRSVLGVEEAWITDKSCLWHFALGGSLEDLYKRIEEFYGVDVRDVPEGNIVQILERIEAARSAQRADR